MSGSSSPNRDAWQKLGAEERFRDLSDYARPLALGIVRLLRDTPVRSQAVTLAFLAVGLAAAAIVLEATTIAFLIAAFLVQVKNLLDAVDGSLARAQGRPSRVGRFLDSVCDFLVQTALFGSFAVVSAPALGPSLAGLLAAAALLCTFLQCTYYTHFTVAYRTRHRGTIMSKLDETTESDEEAGLLLRCLKNAYRILYGWQDRWVQAWVRFATGGEDARGHPELLGPRRMTWISLFGLGTQLLLLSAALVLAALARSPAPLVGVEGLFVGLNLLILGDLIWIRWRTHRRPGR